MDRMKPERRLRVTPLTLEVVREPAHLEHLKAEWTRFSTTVEIVTPFQLPEWQMLWWKHFGEGRLHIMLFRSVDALVAILPFYLHEQTLRLLGTGLAGSLEPMVLKSRSAEVVNLLKGHLAGNTAWQACAWRNLRPTSPLLTLNLGTAFEMASAPDTASSELPVAGTFQQFWDARPFTLRRNFLKYLDKSAFADRPRFEGVAQADPEFVNALIRLGGQQFGQAKDGAPAFLSDLSRVLDDADLLRIFALRWQGKLVAVVLAIVYRGILYAVAGGHDADFEAQGFGRLLLFECLRHAFEQGYRGWSFLGGDDAYMTLWGAQRVPTVSATIRRTLL